MSGLDIQTVLETARGVALDISAAAVTAYESRCVLTKGECEGLHFSGCRSRLPRGECTSNDMTTAVCAEEDCGSVQDFSNPVLRIPDSIQGVDGNITDLDVIETVCYGIILDGPLSDGYEGSQSADAVSSVFTYFGSWNGVMRQYPGASYSSECGTYDPRIRPWYVAASSGPKDVVIIVDISGSMDKNNRFALATEALNSVLATMNEHTFVNIVLLESESEVLTPESVLIPATDANKEMLLNLFADVLTRGSTNYEDALTTTFNLLETSRALGDAASAGCSTAILFLTDGEITQGLGFDNPSEISDLVQALNADIGAQIFTFALGPEADSETLSAIACGSGGIFQAIPDGGSLSTAMSFYYRYYAIGLGGNPDYTAYSSIYEFSSGPLGFTVASPAYDQASDPPAFLGVSGVDFTVQSFLDLGFSEGEIEDAVFLGGKECPAFNITYCQLQQFRGSISAESVCADNGGLCTTAGTTLEPVRCLEDDEYTTNVWSNDELAGLTFEERNCCGSDAFDPSVVATTCEIDDSGSSGGGGGGGDINVPVIVGAAAGVAAAVLILCVAGRYYRKKKSKKDSPNGTNTPPAIDLKSSPEIVS
eukprot:g19335.t2